MKDLKCRIINNEEVAAGVFKMDIEAGYIAKGAQPGQFVHVRCKDTTEPLLRRPLSIHGIAEGQGPRGKGQGTVELLYKTVGRGTQILSEKRPGELLEVLGPLGNGFDLPSTIDHRQSTILIAGGMGIAPLAFLAKRLSRQSPHVIIGARTKDELHCLEELRKLGVNIHICTDDGSKGFKGFATDLLRKLFRNPQSALRTRIYACGPKAMLKQAAAIAKENEIPCQVSLENWMGCGIGACLGCALKTIHGFKRVCKDGPVFNAQEIIWQ